MSLIQLIYSSKNTIKTSNQSQLSQLRDILVKTRHNNTRDHVTGFLIADHAHFFQILEGEREQVLQTYRRIEKDPRHSDIKLIQVREVEGRYFAEWAMGAVIRSLDHEEVYLRHGVSGPIDPAKMSGQKVLALALDLRDLDAARKRPAA